MSTNQALEKLIELLDTGGPVVYILAALSVIVLTITIVKIIQFLVAGVFQNRTANKAVDLFRKGLREEAFHLVNQRKKLGDQLIARSIFGLVFSSLKREEVREEVFRDAAIKVEALRGQLRILELIAMLAPLLGLFGTVVGMIDAFQALEKAGNQVDPSILSGGIWVALLTTAAGLAVAMPTVVIHNYLDSRLEKFVLALDDLMTRLFVADFNITPTEVKQNVTAI